MSVENVESFASDVAAAHEDVVASAQDRDDAVFDQIETARADFQDAVDSIPDDGTMAGNFAKFAEAWRTYVTTVGEPLNRGCSAPRRGRTRAGEHEEYV